MSYTGGIWSVENGSTTGKKVVSLGVPKNRRNVAHVGGPDRDSNARLISAAPELYEALIALMRFREPVEEEEWQGYRDAEESAIAAIRKAEGR